MKTNEAKTMASGISEAIIRRALEIKALISLGWTKAAAVESVRQSSTLGEKSWELIMREVA